MAGVGLSTGIIITALAVLCGERPLHRDMREPTYLRTAGPVELVGLKFGHILRLSDRAIPMDRKPARAVRNLNWATVDYSRHAKLVLAVWDRAGNPVYQFSGITS